MVFLISGLILLNLLFYGGLTYTWRIISAQPAPSPSGFSVIVPVRNEEANVVPLLRALASQRYDPRLFEILIVDDYSEDATREKVEAFAQNTEHTIRLLRLKPKEGMGKKSALTMGVREARFECVITTDADCLMGKEWLATYAHHWGDKQLLAGPVAIHGSSLFAALQQVEFAGLVGFGAVTLERGSPSICSGANLAFKKEAFEKVGGYADNIHLASGDDEFLLYSIFQSYPEKVGFLKDKKALVQTPAHRSWRALLNQRKRWTSKWRHHKNRHLRLAAIFFFFENLGFLGVGILSFLVEMVPLFVVLVVVRCGLSSLYIHFVNRSMGLATRFVAPLLLQLFYPFHVCFMGMNSIFGSYSWKGRHY